MITIFQINLFQYNKLRFLFFITVIFSAPINAQKYSYFNNDHLVGLHHWEIPSKDTDRIILNIDGDPSSKRAVT